MRIQRAVDERFSRPDVFAFLHVDVYSARD